MLNGPIESVQRESNYRFLWISYDGDRLTGLAGLG